VCCHVTYLLLLLQHKCSRRFIFLEELSNAVAKPTSTLTLLKMEIEKSKFKKPKTYSGKRNKKSSSPPCDQCLNKIKIWLTLQKSSELKTIRKITSENHEFGGHPAASWDYLILSPRGAPFCLRCFKDTWLCSQCHAVNCFALLWNIWKHFVTFKTVYFFYVEIYEGY
jgi:FtsZ-binding cell division protein ZapB